jgi:uracil-DNA glycosylase family 4
MLNLADVYEAYRSDSGFDHLRTDGIVLVPGEGSSAPKVMIVGEAPGAMENTLRRPFVGASGAVLRSLITDVAKLRPEDYFITNVVKYRPPGNRTPTGTEIQRSLAYLRQEWGAVGGPPVLIAVGAVAKVALCHDVPGGILSNSGKSFAAPAGPGRRWIMTHPAYALRNEVYRPTMEEHWERFGSWYREEYGS